MITMLSDQMDIDTILLLSAPFSTLLAIFVSRRCVVLFRSGVFRFAFLSQFVFVPLTTETTTTIHRTSQALSSHSTTTTCMKINHPTMEHSTSNHLPKYLIREATETLKNECTRLSCIHYTYLEECTILLEYAD